MIILAIETSCDDTSIAIFRNNVLLWMHTQSQIKIHNITGWVIPEVAAREHANAIFEVCADVLHSSNVTLEEIDYIGVTSHPGLIPSLLTGLTFARTLSHILKKPLLELDHIEGHIFSNFLERDKKEIEFPVVCLTVSGWHNDIYFMNSMWEKQLVWQSQDDAAGESYDKVARMMGLSYPGGPIISQLASEYVPIWVLPENIPENYPGCFFPRVWLDKSQYDFSFSWLKSSVKREIEKRTSLKWPLDDFDKREIAFEFQNAVNEVLAYKLISSALEKWVSTIMLAGWVSANNDLKDKIQLLAWEHNLKFIFPVKNLYSMDNAAMIGILAYYKIISKKF